MIPITIDFDRQKKSLNGSISFVAASELTSWTCCHCFNEFLFNGDLIGQYFIASNDRHNFVLTPLPVHTRPMWESTYRKCFSNKCSQWAGKKCSAWLQLNLVKWMNCLWKATQAKIISFYVEMKRATFAVVGKSMSISTHDFIRRAYACDEWSGARTQHSNTLEQITCVSGRNA